MRLPLVINLDEIYEDVQCLTQFLKLFGLNGERSTVLPHGSEFDCTENRLPVPTKVEHFQPDLFFLKPSIRDHADLSWAAVSPIKQ